MSDRLLPPLWVSVFVSIKAPEVQAISWRIDLTHVGIYLWDIPTESPMVETTLFKSNKSQAVRLPRDVAFPDDVRDVTIIRDGKRRIIAPSDSSWDDFFAAPGIDLESREQPETQVRDEL